MDAEDLLKIRRSQQEQRYAAKKSEPDPDPEAPEIKTWLGKDSNDGQGVTRSPNGQISRGNVVTNGQIFPGLPVLTLQGNMTTFNQMPTPYPVLRPKKRPPRIDYKAESAFLAEIVYEAEEAFPPSCETRLSAIYTRKQAVGDIAILAYTIQSYAGSHPDALCPCSKKWAPTTSGCVLTCNIQGEFTDQASCEDFRENPPTGSYTLYHAVRYSLSNPRTFVAAIPSSSWAYYETDSNIYVVKAKSGDPDRIFTYNSITQQWVAPDNELLDWDDVDVYYVGQGTRWEGGLYGSIVSTERESQAIDLMAGRWQYPVGVPPSGKLFQEGYYIDSTTGEWVLNFNWGYGDNVTGWQPEVIEFPPPDFPSSVPPTEDYLGRYWTVKFYIAGITETPIALSKEYLIQPTPSDYESALGGYPDNYLHLISDDSLVNAYMCRVEKNKIQVVIKYGKNSKRIPYQGYYQPSQFEYHWCAIDVYTITGSSVSLTTYNQFTPVQLDPKNWTTPMATNWYWTKYQISQGQYDLISSDRGASLLQIFNGSEVQINPNIAHRAIAEYLYGLYSFNGVHSENYPLYVVPSGSSSPLKIQGARIGADAHSPDLIPLMGVNFIQDPETNKWYITDCDLKQWVNAANNILVEAIASTTVQDISVKVGEAEVIFQNYSEGEGGGTAPLSNSSSTANVRLKNVAGVFGKKAFKLNIEHAGILEAQAWVDIADIKESTTPIPSVVYQSIFKRILGEGEQEYLGIYTWTDKYPFTLPANIEAPRRYNLTGVIADPPYLLKDCQGNTVVSVSGNITIGQSIGVDPGSAEDKAQWTWRPKITGRCE